MIKPDLDDDITALKQRGLREAEVTGTHNIVNRVGKGVVSRSEQ